MRVRVEQGVLSKGLTTVGKAVSPKAPPVLANVLVRAAEGELLLAATNGDLTITVRCDAQVDEPGAAAVPARELAATVANLPTGQIELAGAEGAARLGLQAGRTAIQLNGMDPEQYPTPVRPPEFSLRVGSADLRQALRRVVGVAAKDSPRPVYNGVLLEIDGEAGRLTATDGFRLASQAFRLVATPAQVRQQVVLPTAPLHELEWVLGQDKEPGEVEIGLASEGRVVGLRYRDTTLVARLLDGRYPGWRAILPRDETCRLEFDRQAMLRAASFAKVFVPEGNKVATVVLDVRPAQNEVVVGVEGAQLGEVQDAVEAQVQGEPLVVRFNHQYLDAVLTTLDSARLILKLASAQDPALFVLDESDEYLHVVVPLTSRAG